MRVLAGGRRHKWRSPVLCLTLLALLGANSVQAACSLNCAIVEGAQGPDMFKPGSTYTYNLETQMSVQMVGSDPQETAIKVQAQVLVTAGPNCVHTMQVKKFGLWSEVAGQKAVAQKMAKEIEADLDKPVNFAMKGQKLGKDICAGEDDSVFSVNVKRGLISLLQGHPVDRGSGSEYDVFGKCPITNSEMTTSGDATRIFIKRKDLNKCDGREQFHATGLVRSVFNPNSDVKATPIMYGDYSLEQRIKSGQTHPDFIQLTEYYEGGSLVSFLKTSVESGIGNAVKSKVVSKLIFQNTKGGKVGEPKNAVPKFINYETTPNAKVSNMEALKTAIKSMIDTGFGPNGNVLEFMAEKFLQVVRMMRDTKKDDLLTLFQQIKSGTVHENRNLAKKLYFDALFRANSGDSVEAISTLVAKNMDATEQKIAYMSLQFAGQLNKNSLQMIQKLLDFNPSYEAYLVAGTLIQKYCDQFTCTNAVLKPIMDKFASQLKCTGKMDKKAEHNMIAILKGLKNSNQISIDSVLDKVYQCYQESIKIKRVRVQSVKTISASVCHTAKGRDILKSILKEQTVDPEFRIQAYLGLIKNCPNKELLLYIQGVYNSEETNQLIGFIKTHIQSLKMSTDPGRQEMKNLVRDFDLSKHHLLGIDFRKTSFNYEHSYNLDSFGVGGSVDNTVIFTKNGFLPRSMNFNFTTELFGRDFNFLEVEVRQENLETISEKFFGPKGWFKTHKNQEIVDKVEQSLDQFQTDTNLNLDRFNYRRRRRDAINLKEDTNKFNKNLNNVDQDINTDLDLDFSINMFGSEVGFLALSDCDWYKDANGDFLKKLTKSFNEALDGAKDFDKTTEAYHLLLDTEFEFPTTIGIPLKSRNQVSMATKLGTSLKVDLRDFFFSKNPSSDFKFHVHLSPSMSIAAHAGLYMDTGVQQLGIQLTGNLYTSVSGSLDFKVQDKGHKWNMDFTMKDKKQEFVKFDHKIIFVQQEKGSLPTETPLKFHAKKTEFVACFDQIYPHTGVTVCADYSFSIPDYKTTTVWTALSSLITTSMNGPNRVGLWLEVDPSYNFQLLFENKIAEGINTHSVEFSMDAPNPKYNRLVKFRAEAGIEPKVYAKIAIISPFRTSSAEIGYRNDNKEVVVYGEAEDNSNKYLAKLGLEKTGAREYTPIFLIQYPDHRENSIFGYSISGKILVDEKPPGMVYNFRNLEIRKTKNAKQVVEEPILINGKVEYVPVAFTFDLETRQGGNKINIAGNIDVNPQNFIINVKTDSNNQNLIGEFFYNFQYQKNALVSQDLKFKSGQKKDYDIVAIQRIEFDKEVLDQKKTDEFWSAVTKLELKAEWQPVHPGLFDFSYKIDKSNNFDTVLKFKCKDFNFDNQLVMKRPNRVDYDMNYNLIVNKFFIKILSKMSSDGSTGDVNKKNFVNKVQLSNGFAMDLNGNFLTKFKTGDFELKFDNQLTDNTKKAQYKLGFDLKNAAKDLNWNLKLNLLSQPTDFLTGKFNLKKNENFVLEMIIRDIVQINSDFKFSNVKAVAPAAKNQINPVNAKGEGFVLVKFPKVNNYQVKVNTKFLFNEPNYNLDMEFFYDFEKDNSKKAVLSSHNICKKNMHETKNSLDVMGDKYQLNGNYEMSGAVDNGVIKFYGEFILPSTRTFSMDFKRKLDRKAVTDNEFSYSGTADLYLKDVNPEKQVRLITVNGKLGELNVKRENYDVQYKIEIQDYDKSNIIFEPKVKTVKGEQLDIGLTVYGKMLPERLTLDFNLKNELKKSDQINFDLKSNYGKSIALNTIGHFKMVPGGTNFDYKVFSKLTIDPVSLQKTVTVGNAAIAKFKSVELNLQGKSSGKIEQSFEWHFINEVKVNENQNYHANLDLTGNFESFLNTKLSVLLEPVEKTPFVLESSYLINKNVQPKETSDNEVAEAISKTPMVQFFRNGGEFLTKVNYRGGEEVKLNVLVNKQSEPHTMTAHLTSTLEKFKDHKLIMRTKNFDTNNWAKLKVSFAADYFQSNVLFYKGVFVVDSSADAPAFEMEFDNQQAKVKSSLKIASKIDQSANHFYGEVIMVNFPIYEFSLDSKIDWTNYQLVATDPVKINIKANCDKWNLKNFDMTIKGSRAGTKADIELNAVNAGKNVVSGQLKMAEGAASGGDSTVLIEGAGNLKWQDGANRKLTFNLLRKKFPQNDQHLELLLNGQLDKKNFLFEFKVQDKVTIARHSICMEGDQRCTNIELKSHRKSTNYDNFEHDFVMNFDVRPLGGIFENYYNNFGLNWNTKKSGMDFAGDFNLFVENQHRKYQIMAKTRNPGTQVEISYPGRQIAFDLTHKLPTVNVWAYDFGTTFWMNKAKDAGNKFEIRTLANAEFNRDKQEWSSTFNAFAQHPKMKKISIDGTNVWNFDLNAKRLIDTKVVFDIFQNADDKITIQIVSSKAFHPGDYVSYEFVINMIEKNKQTPIWTEEYYMSIKKGEMLYKLKIDYPKPNIFNGDVNFNKAKGTAKGRLDIGGRNVIDSGATYDQKAKAVSGYINVNHVLSDRRVLSATSKVVYYNQAIFDVTFDRVAILHFDYTLNKAVSVQLKSSDNKELFVSSVALDTQNFLATQYKMSEKDIQAFLDNLKAVAVEEYEQNKKEISSRVQQVQNEFKTHSTALQQKLPDMSKLSQDYKIQFEELYKEIQADPTLKHIFEAIQKIGMMIYQISQEFVKHVMVYASKIFQIVKEFGTNTWQTIHDHILPPVLEFLSSLRDIGQKFIETAWKLVQRLVQEFNAFFGKYQADLNKIIKQVSEQLRDLHAVVVKFSAQLRTELENILNTLIDFIKEILNVKQTLHKIGELLREYKYDAYVKEFGAELIKFVNDNKLFTEETKKFLNTLINYITTKLTSLEMPNADTEVAELKQLGSLLFEALKSIYEYAKSLLAHQKGEVTKSSFYNTLQQSTVDVQKMQEFIRQNFVNFPLLSPMGAIEGDVSTSPLKIQWSEINYLTSVEFYKSIFGGDWSRVWEFGRISNIIPPYKFHAQIIDGAHFMTFDGLHYTFDVNSGGTDSNDAEPEGCYFVLAADSQYGNFTVIGTFNNKKTDKLNSIVIVDQKGNTFELKNNDKVYWNNKPKELPIHSDVHAWRNYHQATEILHPAGVRILCERKLAICTITLDGYYKNKVRGLFGNANDEKVDELQLINGQYVDNSEKSFESFYQNYQLKKFNKQCPKLVAINAGHGHHGHHESPECEKTFKTFNYFGRVLPYFDNYVEGCQHAVSMVEGFRKEQVACIMTEAYVRKLRSEYNILARTPDTCIRECVSTSEAPAIKVDNKKLDLVLLVDFNNTAYIDLLPGLIQELKTSLKSRDVSDYKMTLVGYNKDWEYPFQIPNIDAQPKFNYQQFISDNLATMPRRSDKFFYTKWPTANKILTEVWKNTDKIENDVGVSSDAQAFQYTFNYPYRAEAIKTVLIFRGDPLNYSPNPLKTASAKLVNNLSAARGIQMHLMSPVQEFTLTGSPANVRNTKLIIGFNQKTVIQNADAKKRANVGATNLRPSVQFKQDMGTDFVLGNNEGNNFVFITQNYQQRAAKDKKVFVQAMVNAITEQMPRLDISQLCHCDVADGLYERDVCLVKDVQLLPQAPRKPERRG